MEGILAFGEANAATLEANMAIADDFVVWLNTQDEFTQSAVVRDMAALIAAEFEADAPEMQRAFMAGPDESWVKQIIADGPDLV